MRILVKTISLSVSAALIIAAIFLAYVAVPYFGNKALIVRSGSMQPAIGVGDLVVVKGAENTAVPIPGTLPKYSVGDIVAFYSEKNSKTMITHRVSRVEVTTDKILYETKGDANNAPDNNLTPEDKVLGKSMFTIPSLGKVFAAAKTREGFFALILAPAILVIIFEIITITHEIKKIRKKKVDHYVEEARESLRSNMLLRVLVPMVLGTMFFQNSFSSYADTEISLGNVLQAGEFEIEQDLSAPCISFTGASVVINEINWAGSNGDGNDEWIELCNTTGSPINLTNWVVENLGTGNGPNANVVIPSGTIPANGFFIVSANDQASSKINVPSDLVDTNVNLGTGGKQLLLKNHLGVVIDTANGTGSWLAGNNSTPKKSMERINPVSDGTQSIAWQTAFTHTNMDASGPTDEFGTPKAQNGL